MQLPTWPSCFATGWLLPRSQSQHSKPEMSPSQIHGLVFSILKRMVLWKAWPATLPTHLSWASSGSPRLTQMAPQLVDTCHCLSGAKRFLGSIGLPIVFPSFSNTSILSEVPLRETNKLLSCTSKAQGLASSSCEQPKPTNALQPMLEKLMAKWLDSTLGGPGPTQIPPPSTKPEPQCHAALAQEALLP